MKKVAFTMRIPGDIYRNVCAEAQRIGISINAWLLTVIIEKLSKK